jgi:hypothetical protein
MSSHGREIVVIPVSAAGFRQISAAQQHDFNLRQACIDWLSALATANGERL